MANRLWIICLVLMTGLLSHASYGYDNELWVSATKKLWDNQSNDVAADTKLFWYTEVRQRDDAQETYGAFNGVIVRHDVNPYLQLGAGIKHIALRSRNGSFDPRFRTELEVTPKLPLGEHNSLSLSLRNRWEMFKDKGKKDLNRMRHRLQLSGNINGKEWLKGWYVSHELIYTLKRGKYDLRQYRMVPLGMKFRVNETSFNAFYMLARSSGNPNGDNYDHVLGFSFAL